MPRHCDFQKFSFCQASKILLLSSRLDLINLKSSLRYVCRKKTSLFKLENRLYVLYRPSAAWPSGSERRFYDDRYRKVDGSTTTHVSLLRSWIRCFTITISAWWNLTNSKLKKSEAKPNWKTRIKDNSLASLDSSYVYRLRRFLVTGG